MRKILIVVIALMPFITAHAENTPTPATEKATTSEITAPPAEKAKEDKAAEKPKVVKANTPKKQKMGKAGGKGG